MIKINRVPTIAYWKNILQRLNFATIKVAIVCFIFRVNVELFWNFYMNLLLQIVICEIGLYFSKDNLQKGWQLFVRENRDIRDLLKIKMTHFILYTRVYAVRNTISSHVTFSYVVHTETIFDLFRKKLKFNVIKNIIIFK